MSYYYNINVIVKRFIVYEVILYDLYLFYIESRVVVEWVDSWWGILVCIWMVFWLYYVVYIIVGFYVIIIFLMLENRLGKFEFFYFIKNY